ncbi:MAG: transketolase [Atopobiaceae bacterium]|nr:transketolase [Atopobiaceae bacterium]
MHSIQELEKMAHRARVRALEMGIEAGRMGQAVHFGSSLSEIEILTVLYQHVLQYNVHDPESPDRDRFFMGKAQGILGHYPALLEAGFITKEELRNCRNDGSILLGHPTAIELGLEYDGGSLGTAFSYAAGLSMALKRAYKANKVYVLLGDGECDEGVFWETVIFVAHQKLDNLTLIIDRNMLQLEDATENMLGLGDLSNKLSAFGWRCVDVDGHDIRALLDAFDNKHEGRPFAVVAHTIKGKGISFMEHNPTWHQRRITEAEYEMACAELGEVRL